MEKIYNNNTQESSNISGKVQKIYKTPDDMFFVLYMLVEKEHIKLIGYLFGIKVGDNLRAWGNWEKHPKYGKQFKVTRWEKVMPSTEEQVVEFLSSSLVKGVGKITARRIAEKLGADALNIILDNGPEALYGIKNLNKKNADKIHNSLQETFEIQRVVMQLSEFGLTAALAIRAYNKYGSAIAELIKQNPYCLTEVSLIGFQTADEIAEKIGINKDSPYRIKAALKYTLNTASISGHCYLDTVDLAQKALELLNHNGQFVNDTEVTKHIANDKHMVINGKDAYLEKIFEAENEVAANIRCLRRKNSTRVPPNKIGTRIKKYELANRINLEQEQREAVHKLFETNLLILTGGPGTGKSTTVKAILNVFKDINPNAEVLLAAPTGKASRRLAEITGYDAATMHRLLGIKPEQRPLYNEENPLAAELIILDECSMVDIFLTRTFFKAVSPDTKILLVGDTDQLPSVGPGNILGDLIKAGLPSVQLKRIFRQAQKSQIITNAHRINHGHYITVDDTKGDFYFIKREAPSKIAETTIICYQKMMEKGYGADEIQVLTPMKRGENGTIELNRQLQQAINPPSPLKAELIRGQMVYRVGDKVMQIKNNYELEVFNGEVGVVRQVIELEDEDGLPTGKKGLLVSYNSDDVLYKPEALEQLVLAYAITTHKSQGGEWPVIITPVTTQHYTMLARNILYTAITRAKKTCILIGTDKALSIAIKNNKISSRNTRLTERLTNQTPMALNS